VQTRVDDLEPRIAQAAGDHLDPAVVTVEARFRDDDPLFPGHAGQSTDALRTRLFRVGARRT
jgi:hypothetical protein